MNVARRWVLIIIAAGSIIGGALGGVVLKATTGNAASSNTTTTNSSSAMPSGTFRPNENAGHESGESAAREAQEAAGQVPTVP
jgi:hypothetical protein